MRVYYFKLKKNRISLPHLLWNPRELDTFTTQNTLKESITQSGSMTHFQAELMLVYTCTPKLLQPAKAEPYLSP